jgi:UTP--glucose-1-phosphate uridylyltransferase
VQRIAKEDSEKYGVIAVDNDWQEKGQVKAIVEKPKPSDAPSQYGVVGRYILTAETFDHLKQLSPGSGGEIQLTDAIARLLKEQKVMALQFQGIRYDCGSKLGYMQAMIALGLKHPELGPDFKKYLQGVL